MVRKSIIALAFSPDIFRPEFSLITLELVEAFHKKDILVIPWTPDILEEIQKLKDMRVDGAIIPGEP